MNISQSKHTSEVRLNSDLPRMRVQRALSEMCRKRIEKEVVDAGETFYTDDTGNEKR